MSLAVNTQKRMGLICAAATLGFVLISPPSFGAEDGPFAGLSGAWAGGGDISMTDGSRERILCRAQYSVGEAGRSLVQHLRCASASYRLEISADVQDRGGALYGSWSEAAHGEFGLHFWPRGGIRGSSPGSRRHFRRRHRHKFAWEQPIRHDNSKFRHGRQTRNDIYASGLGTSFRRRLEA